METTDQVTRLSVKCQGWDDIRATYFPHDDTIFVNATTPNHDKICTFRVLWHRDGNGTDLEEVFNGDPAMLGDLTDRLFNAVWSAAPDAPEKTI